MLRYYNSGAYDTIGSRLSKVPWLSSLSTFSDYHEEKIYTAMLGYPGTGGYWSLSSWSGIFYEYPPSASDHTASAYGSRLSKVP